MATTKDVFDSIITKVLNVQTDIKIAGTSILAELQALSGAAAGVATAGKNAVYDAAGKLYRSSASPAAAGTTIADAAPITAEFNTVTGADGSAGVLLPVAAADEVVVVVNTNASNILKVYAVTGSQINALGSTVAFSIPPGQAAVFYGRSATLWYTAAPLTIQGVAAGYKVARGQRTMLSASDTIATGLATVVAVVVSMESDPVLTFDRVTAQIGNQSGSPVAGSIIIKGWMPTGAALTTPVAATGYSGIKVNWIALGT